MNVRPRSDTSPVIQPKGVVMGLIELLVIILVIVLILGIFTRGYW